MRKRDLIDRVISLNPTAQAEFLAQFDEQSLMEYLDNLLEVQLQPHPTAQAVDLPILKQASIPVAAAPAVRLDDADVPLASAGEGQMSLTF